MKSWQLVNRKADFLLSESIRIDSHNESNRIDSNRELECSSAHSKRRPHKNPLSNRIQYNTVGGEARE